MKIDFVEIQNFRKLQSCRVDFAERETVFVGANNSGKTSAMDALILFLRDKSRFSTRDFTLSNWKAINDLGKSWVNEERAASATDLTIEKWQDHLPSLDVWIKVESFEIQHVMHLIPTLDWKSGLLGIRLRLEPKSIEDLYKDFHSTYSSSKNAKEEAQKSSGKNTNTLKLWPATMWDFLEKRLHSHFEIRSYILDPKMLVAPDNGFAKPQQLIPESLPLDNSSLKGLIKVNIINAQRGFSDPNSEGVENPKLTGNLSTQLREYYSKHLNPFEQPNSSDIGALQAIDDAKSAFDDRLRDSFKASLGELEGLNYPGFGNPSINISSKINAIDGLDHETSVQFGLLNPEGGDSANPLSLPEKYNGLGYQNLISMVFKLIRFRDEWMQVGKSLRPAASGQEAIEFEPLHLVLVEEPEAHLHAQVQQVFIRKAYEVLRNHKLLGKEKKFQTQLIVSTHSNHIAHEIDFTSLRYFKRMPRIKEGVPTSIVVNLSQTFGAADDTTKFAIRYLRTTHCDLFFADAVILIEGSAERMLVPHFIKHHYPDLASCYISFLEIGGSHAHTLKPLIEALGIITLVVTDIDSIDPSNNRKSVMPVKGKGYETANATIKKWLPAKADLDELLGLDADKKKADKFPVRIAYQFPIKIQVGEKGKKGATEHEVIPYTFEDALTLGNLEIFKGLTGTGLIKKFSDAAKKTDIAEACKEMYDALINAKKAEFALELLFLEEPNKLKTPEYIAEGLDWLHDMLKSSRKETALTKL